MYLNEGASGGDIKDGVQRRWICGWVIVRVCEWMCLHAHRLLLHVYQTGNSGLSSESSNALSSRLPLSMSATEEWSGQIPFLSGPLRGQDCT